MIQELENRIKRLEAKFNQVIREGVVTSVLDDQGAVRVRLVESDCIISKPLPVLFVKTQDNKDYDLPDIGEQVLCLFLPTGLEQGYVLGSWYSAQDRPPVTDRNKKHYAYSDGTWMEYDRKEHKLTINIKGSMDIHADGTIEITSGNHIRMTAPIIDLN